jgi:hypothetical protein
MKAMVLVGVTVLAGTAACSGGEIYDPPDTDSACPAQLMLGGQTYDGTDTVVRSPRGERFGSAQFTGCDDGHGRQDANAEVPAWNLPGTDVEDAFLAKMGGDFYLYIAEDLANPCSVKAAHC